MRDVGQRVRIEFLADVRSSSTTPFLESNPTIIHTFSVKVSNSTCGNGSELTAILGNWCREFFPILVIHNGNSEWSGQPRLLSSVSFSASFFGVVGDAGALGGVLGRRPLGRVYWNQTLKWNRRLTFHQFRFR